MNSLLNKVTCLLLSLAAVLLSGQAAWAQAKVSAEKQTYGFSEPITVQWSGMPVQKSGWIAIGRPGTGTASSEHQSQSINNYHGDLSSGRHTFRGFPPGTYEIRLLLPPYGNETVLARATITVGGQAAQGLGAPSLKADKEVYEQMEEIKVTWSSISLVNGFVGIGKRGGGAFSFADREPSTSLPSNWQGKPANGSFTFPGRLAGEYEIRIVTDYYGSQVLLRAPITVKE